MVQGPGRWPCRGPSALLTSPSLVPFSWRRFPVFSSSLHTGMTPRCSTSCPSGLSLDFEFLSCKLFPSSALQRYPASAAPSHSLHGARGPSRIGSAYLLGPTLSCVLGYWTRALAVTAPFSACYVSPSCIQCRWTSRAPGSCTGGGASGVPVTEGVLRSMLSPRTKRNPEPETKTRQMICCGVFDTAVLALGVIWQDFMSCNVNLPSDLQSQHPDLILGQHRAVGGGVVRPRGHSGSGKHRLPELGLEGDPFLLSSL